MSNNERESPDIFHEYYEKLSPVEIRHEAGEEIFETPQRARGSRRVCRKLFTDSQSYEDDATGGGGDGESAERRRWRLQRQKHQQEVRRRRRACQQRQLLQQQQRSWWTGRWRAEGRDSHSECISVEITWSSKSEWKAEIIAEKLSRSYIREGPALISPVSSEHANASSQLASVISESEWEEWEYLPQSGAESRLLSQARYLRLAS